MPLLALLSFVLAAQPADFIGQLRSADPAVRLRAVQHVERLGADGSPDEAYLAPLAKLLADPDLQTRGLAALALSRHVVACTGRVPDGVVMPLLLALRDENPHVAAYCGRAFTTLGERAFPQVRAALAADQPRKQRLAALEGCRRLLAVPVLREPIGDLYWSLLADADAVVRERVFVLLRLARAEEILPPLRDAKRLAVLLCSADRRLRDLGVSQVSALDGAAFPILGSLLDSPDPGHRIEAARVLGHLLDTGAVPPLDQTLTLLARVNQQADAGMSTLQTALRRTAQAQLYAARNQIVAEASRTFPLVPLLVGPTVRFVREVFANEEARALERFLESSDVTIRQIAAEGLWPYYKAGHEPSPEAVETLAEALHAPETGLRRAAARALRLGLRPTRRIPDTVLAALHLGIVGKDDWVRIDCTYALATCGMRAEPLLVALLQAQDPEVQYRAAEAVIIMVYSHDIYPTKTEPFLKRLRQSPLARVAEVAGQALDALKRPRPPEKKP